MIPVLSGGSQEGGKAIHLTSGISVGEVTLPWHRHRWTRNPWEEDAVNGPRGQMYTLLGERMRANEWKRPSLARAGDVRRRPGSPILSFCSGSSASLFFIYRNGVSLLLRLVQGGDGTTVIHLVGYWALVGSLEELWLARGRKKSEKASTATFDAGAPMGTIVGRRDGLVIVWDWAN
ncbi:hypothetical protein CSAL01_05878 [Colletotrichum salicis]|uniref:Uncharacterized protein n=1 Tax=Colletotrichum salicis TaxID=1209931 RepID=A0A135RVJ1_9PEZI|nr:hypothetical protein CSAL01_05878 [Colletotrichum salicis]